MSTISHTLNLFTCVLAMMEKAPFNNLLTCEQAHGLLEEHCKFGAKLMSPLSPYLGNWKPVRRLTTFPLRVYVFLLQCASCFLLSRRYHCRFVEVLNNCLKQHRHAINKGFKSSPKVGKIDFWVLTVTSVPFPTYKLLEWKCSYTFFNKPLELYRWRDSHIEQVKAPLHIAAISALHNKNMKHKQHCD